MLFFVFYLLCLSLSPLLIILCVKLIFGSEPDSLLTSFCVCLLNVFFIVIMGVTLSN